MPHRLAAGTTPLATRDGVRFTLFHETRGPQVYEVEAQVLRSCFGAPDDRVDHLLTAYLAGQAEIHDVAAGVPGGPHGSITRLGPQDFAGRQG
ncbi:hypothetical protein EGT29_10770 [Pigmentiphaga sp. H8]|uniref:hypothetical protein n=1 Tax=unclassified Pigmentiphaga TaxID=2626614 RepID=UPI000F5960DB|nr:hypothetical protein [Pigmentiphaga sp. H8]AZG08328.1 hypothetical protein EGT29_10770 [Pigmentiphaga sp. H8]